MYLMDHAECLIMSGLLSVQFFKLAAKFFQGDPLCKLGSTMPNFGRKRECASEFVLSCELLMGTDGERWGVFRCFLDICTGDPQVAIGSKIYMLIHNLYDLGVFLCLRKIP